MQKNHTDLHLINKDNKFSLNDYFFNIRDSVFSMIINIISPEENNEKYINTNLMKNRKMKSPNEINKINNNKGLSINIKDKVNKNKTYNRNANNKLYEYFIKKEKKESIKKMEKDKLLNVNITTINPSELKNNHSRNNKFKEINKGKNTIKEEYDNFNNTNNINVKYNQSKNNINKFMCTSLNYNKISNLKMSQKIHFYVENIIDKIPYVQNTKNNNIKIKENNMENTKDNFNNQSLSINKYNLNKNRKNHSQSINKNKIFYNNFIKNRTTFNNYITSLYNYNIIKNNINISNEKNNKNKTLNSYYYIEENENYNKNIFSLNIYKKSIFSFQKFLFNIQNIKFKHLLIIFLDQKSITCLSSVNKTFHKNIRNIFFNNLFKAIFSENKDIFIKKIIRSVFKYSLFKSKNKSEFKIFYESMKYPNKIYTDTINNDLLRTFPNDPNFKEGNKYYKRLFNLLTCYSNYNKNIGYAQGLNFIFANAIYLFSTEEDIFLFIDGFINFLKLENFLGINNQKNLPEKINNISHILQKYIPDIINVFNEKFVNIEIFLTNWILTIFSCSMNRKNLITCWCFLILFGWKFFYCFIIQILIQYQNMIFNFNEVNLCNKMKNLLHSKEFNQDFDNIINKTLDFMKENIVL